MSTLSLSRSRRRRGDFSPAQLGKVSGWMRLAASSQSGGEWTPIVDVLNAGSPVTQTDTDRRAAVGAAANGLPTMVFDGSDVYLWPCSPAHASTTKLGLWIWYKPATVSGLQTLYAVVNDVGGSSKKRLIIYANGASVDFRAYKDNFNGRIAKTSSNVLTAGAWSAIYCAYDFSQSGDDKLKIWVGGVAQGITYADDGAGGFGTGLPAADGSATLGAETDSDTPTRPIANGGLIGPNVFAFSDNLTASEIANLLAFEAPT